jgi:hypothetical protein
MTEEQNNDEGNVTETPNTPPVPIEAPEEVPVAEGSTSQPDVASDEEQVATLQQTPNSELAVDPDIEQPSQDSDVVIESDDGAE